MPYYFQPTATHILLEQPSGPLTQLKIQLYIQNTTASMNWPSGPLTQLVVLSLSTIKYWLLPTEYISNSLKAKSYSLLYSECIIGFLIVSEDLKVVPRVCGWLLVGKNMAFILAANFPL